MQITVTRGIDPASWELTVQFDDADLAIAFGANQEALFHEAFLLDKAHFDKKPVSEQCTIGASIAKLVEASPAPAATGTVTLGTPTP
jgi:hypothetical protein